ncbi:MAG: glycine betaine ABC transporter substrate-binding protein [Verrucomicrobiota bacterium]
MKNFAIRNAGLGLLGLSLLLAGCSENKGPDIDDVTPEAPTITVGSKNFPEQLILGEILAYLIEKTTDVKVERKFGYGSTPLISQALEQGEIDLYVEYSGTAEETIFDVAPERSPRSAFNRLKRLYMQRFQAEWMPSLGFNNSYVMVVSKDGPHGWMETLSQYAPNGVTSNAGLNSEFIERPDGYPALTEVYGIKFKDVRTYDQGLLYGALDSGKVDVISAFATDGRLSLDSYQQLRDDKEVFPRYEASPVVRTKILAFAPQLRDLLENLSGKFSEDLMRKLNAMVEIEGHDPRDVARQFVDKNYDLLKSPSMQGDDVPTNPAVRAIPPAEPAN